MTAIGTAWVVRITSPTTYSMTSALNKLPMSLGGILFLKSERTVSPMNIIGISFGFISGLVYSISMIRQSKRNRRLRGKNASSELLSTAMPLQPPIVASGLGTFSSGTDTIYNNINDGGRGLLSEGISKV